MNAPTPALVGKDAVRRLPRLPLALLCLAYLLPGLFGRAPWKNADLTAYGYMSAMAHGLSSWTEPTLGGLGGASSVLPYWIGAGAIRLFGPWLGDPLAARLPFVLLLAFVLWATWSAAYYLARTEAAQPAPYAFGGEAPLVDYARAIGDAALLALIATLGLLQLGHETTPELAQLAGVTLFVLGLALAPFRPWQARLAVLFGLPILATSGSPSFAVMLGSLGVALSLRSAYAPARALIGWQLAATAMAVALATALDLWAWRAGQEFSVRQIGRLLIWFTWPTGPLAAWALWRWRDHVLRRHIAVPVFTALLALLACIFMGGYDRALLLGLPALSILAAFTLPTLRRGFGALIDWFSLFFFSFWALLFWVVYASLRLGIPAKPAQNVLRLLPGYQPVPAGAWTLLALAGTLAWFGLVLWRAGRHRHPLWTSMVLPASGVALGWLLLLTLHLPVIDYARSYRPLTEQIARVVPREACLQIEAPTALRAALEADAGWVLRPGLELMSPTSCPWGLISTASAGDIPVRAGWTWVRSMQRPGDRNDWVQIYRRTGVKP